VPGPARHDVLVNVVEDPCAGNAAQVPAQVVALRPVYGREGAQSLPSQAMDLQRLVVLEVAEIADVPVRRDHDVPRRVRELVQEHERLPSAIDDQAILVACLHGAAEEATLVLVSTCDVFEPPRRPELLRHDAAAYAADP